MNFFANGVFFNILVQGHLANLPFCQPAKWADKEIFCLKFDFPLCS